MFFHSARRIKEKTPDMRPHTQVKSNAAVSNGYPYLCDRSILQDWIAIKPGESENTSSRRATTYERHEKDV